MSEDPVNTKRVLVTFTLPDEGPDVWTPWDVAMAVDRHFEEGLPGPGADATAYEPEEDYLRDLADLAAVHDETSGVTYRPWSNGYAVGFECRHSDGRVEYIYLNPSQETDDGVANVFLYQGTEGDPAQDVPHHHYDLFACEHLNERVDEHDFHFYCADCGAHLGR